MIIWAYSKDLIWVTLINFLWLYQLDRGTATGQFWLVMLRYKLTWLWGFCPAAAWECTRRAPFYRSLGTCWRRKSFSVACTTECFRNGSTPRWDTVRLQKKSNCVARINRWHARFERDNYHISLWQTGNNFKHPSSFHFVSFYLYRTNYLFRHHWSIHFIF